MNVSKAGLEGAFADELALLQPTAGYMRLVKDRILHVWEQRRAEARDRTVEQEKRVKVIQQKLDRLDEAFLFAQSIDATSYERQRDRLREELTLAQIDHRGRRRTQCTGHPGLRRTGSAAHRTCGCRLLLDYKQRLQQLFFPEGISDDGIRFNRTAVTAPLFNYLAPGQSAEEMLVSQTFASWNLIGRFLRQIDGLRRAARASGQWHREPQTASSSTIGSKCRGEALR